jgi:hypothetical protein
LRNSLIFRARARKISELRNNALLFSLGEGKQNRY